MKKIKISLFIFIVFFMFVLVYFNNRLLYEKTKNLNTKVSLSNKKISWGIINSCIEFYMEHRDTRNKQNK